MGLKVIIFLGPRARGRRPQPQRYQFGNYVSKPTRLMGVALFRWLCAEHGLPEQVLVLGEPRSDWDTLHELAAVPYGLAQFQRLGLREQLDQGGLGRAELDGLEGFLEDFLGGVQVRCVCYDRSPGRAGQRVFLTTLDEHIGRGDELHVDVSRDIWACGLFGSAAMTSLIQGSRVHLGGMYAADAGTASMAGVPVLIISELNSFIEWSSAVSVFRESGLLGRLPELFFAEVPRMSEALRAINFAVLTHQYSELYENFQLAVQILRELGEHPTRSLTRFFSRQLIREAAWIEDAHLADWQIEFARRALFSSDYMRAIVLAQEAVVSAAIRRTRARTDSELRRRTREYLMERRDRSELYPVDPWPFFKLWDLREVLAGVRQPDQETRRDIMRNEQTLRQFLERAISFTSVLVARFKRSPVM